MARTCDWCDAVVAEDMFSVSLDSNRFCSVDCAKVFIAERDYYTDRVEVADPQFHHSRPEGVDDDRVMWWCEPTTRGETLNALNGIEA